MMLTDRDIKAARMRALVDALGEVQAEKFVALIQREPFDYTQWQQALWPGKTLEEISAAAVRMRERGE